MDYNITNHLLHYIQVINILYNLFIDDNKIEDEGAKAIGNALKYNKSLIKLNLCKLIYSIIH